MVSRARRRAPALTAASGMLLAGAGYAALTVTGFPALTAAHPDIFLAWRVAGALPLLVIGAARTPTRRGWQKTSTEHCR